MATEKKQLNNRKVKRKLWRDDVQNRLERAILHKRPVTEEDKWCRIRTFKKEEESESKAPYGYVIIIQKYFNHMDISTIDGIIIRNKCINGKIYLQVVEGKSRRYSIRIKKNRNIDGKEEKYLIIKNKNKRKF